MADPEEGTMSRSPREDYDPLDESSAADVAQNGLPLYSGSDQDPESPCSSLDMEPDPLYNYKYGITPPVNSREMKRHKERDRSFKLKDDKHDKLASLRMRQLLQAKTMGDCPSDMTDSVVPEEGNFEEVSKRHRRESPNRRKKDSSRNFKTNRSLDRDLKLDSGPDLTSEASGPSPSQTPISVDSPNRYLSLKCKQVAPANGNVEKPASKIKPLTLSINPRRKTSLTTPECPPERRQFSAIFTTLIQLGNNKKDSIKENHCSTPYSRQVSREQELWQTELQDLLWLELQAWHCGRNMEQQDAALVAAREGTQGVLDTILRFKVNHESTSPTESLNVSGWNYPLPPLLFESVAQQKVALEQVSIVLDKLHEIEQLYPSHRALAIDCPAYNSSQFQERLNLLCLWRNITLAISQTLQLMAKVLFIDKLPNVSWPWLERDAVVDSDSESEDGETQTDSLSDTSPSENQADSGISSYGDAGADTNKAKNVRFDLTKSPCDSNPTSPVKGDNSFLSAQPSDTSTPRKGTAEDAPSMSRSSSCLSVDELCPNSVYRYFVDQTLKKTGLSKLRSRMKSLVDDTLSRAKLALHQPSKRPSYADVLEAGIDLRTVNSGGNLGPKPPEDQFHTPACWSAFDDMGLPSFKPTYLFLVRIPLDVIHECLRLRLEQRPEMEPSILSVGQLIRECKEVLQEAVLVKQYYLNMIAVATGDDPRQERAEAELETFEEDTKEMLELYFGYLQTWMCELQNLPEMSKRLKNALEDEWVFTKQVCRHIRGGEANAGNRFCRMGSSLLNSISDYLDTGMDECIDQLYDCTTGDGLDDSGEHTDLKNLSNRFSFELRHAIGRTCRQFKVLFGEARERASKALGFTKMLHKDLEIAADYNIAVTAGDLLAKLKETKHLRVIAPHSAGYLMFIPAHITQDRHQVLQLLNVTCGSEEVFTPPTLESAGYLLLVKCEGCADMQRGCPLWTGGVLRVEPTADTTIALSHIEVEGLLLVVTQSSLLYTQRKTFEDTVGPVVQLCNENTSCHQAIAESLFELKSAAMELRDKVANAIKQVDEKLSLEEFRDMDEAEKNSILKQYRETLHQCYNFGFEYHKEVTRLVSGEMRVKLTLQLVEFAKQWMKFVAEKCERGRGLRPRWANQGLDFLSYACDPKVLGLLTEEQFVELKQCMNDCICHVIGEKMNPGSPSTPVYRVSSPDHTRHSILRNVSCPDQRLRARSPSTRGISSEPPTPFMSPASTDKSAARTTRSQSSGCSHSQSHVQLKDGEEGGIIIEITAAGDTSSTPSISDVSDGEKALGWRMGRVNASIQALEEHRNGKLCQERVIGHVTSRRLEVDYHVNVRRVKFKWQRGIKIGEGNFGKVYTAVNMYTGELMAMKEIRFQPNDHQTVKDIADEIKIFEAINHPTLVKYYGVEVHRDEMLIFMEYCAHGTIADVAKLGLSEGMVRKYTADILGAVGVLHENGIVHRDIKGPNIFLTENGLKLGDFGCAVKLKNQTTMPAEIRNIAGTTAYIAPEVITKSDQGRAADIWSLGCVVIEMVTGKRPWHELENNFAIMFKVGMGATPPIPESLSEEGHDFLSHCLHQDSRLRWTAAQLMQHQFVKVSDVDWDS